jgi:two-component system, NarL family, sensor histidine kinase FusK
MPGIVSDRRSNKNSDVFARKSAPTELRGASRVDIQWTPSFLVLFIGVTALYFVAAKAGLAQAVVANTVSLTWAPSGIALAALLVYGRRMAFAVALGAFLANAGTGMPLVAAGSIAAGNTLEALAGAWLLARFPGFDVGLRTRRDVLALIVLAAFFGTMVSAVVGVATLAAIGTVAPQDYATAWVKWWLGDMMGMLVVAPPLLLWVREPLRAPSPAKVVEALCLLALLVIVTLRIFGFAELAPTRYDAAPMAVFPFVIWGSLRFRQPGASLVTLVCAVMVVWGASQGTGPFMSGDSFYDVVQWCTFSIVVAVIGLVLAASIAEQQHAQAQLRHSHEKLEQRVTERTRDLLAVNADLHNEMTERRNLEIALIRVSEEQRRVIGSELHDGLGQHLTSLSLLCESLRQKLIDRAQPEADAAQRIGELIGEAAAMNRTAARGLYPVALEHGGLIAALEGLAEDTSSLRTMKCAVSVGRHVQVHDPLVAINLYRIAQEAVNNAVKYSQAGLIRIDLTRADGEHRLTLSDDGIGLRAGADTGMGMYSMRYRANLLGGMLQVSDNFPRGTTVTVTYPDLEDQT